MTSIVFFNGPPSSGKDTYANLVSTKRNSMVAGSSEVHSVKKKLIDLALLIYDIDADTWNSWYTEKGKNISRPELGGLSCRETLIYISEDIIKPNFGDEYFGNACISRIEKAFAAGVTDVYFSDGGFISEIDAIGRKFGYNNLAIVRLHRDGFDFTGDSRSYITHPKVDSFDVETGGDYDYTTDVIMRGLKHLGK